MWVALSACSGADGDLPDAYRTLAVPDTRLASDEARHHGRELYLERCALCHGVGADGNGVRSSGLSSRPADFTRRDWRAGMSPRRIFFIIREGRRGTAMAGWPSLSNDEVWDVVAYLRSVSEAG